VVMLVRSLLLTTPSMLLYTEYARKLPFTGGELVYVRIIYATCVQFS
jgi:hypothetical protein